MTNLKGIVSAFIATRKLRNLSPNTIEFYSKIFNKFLAFMQTRYPDVAIEQIDHFMLREYILGLKNHHSPGGVNHHIKALKILFKFMVGEELVSENPTKKISKLRYEHTVIPPFSNEQIKKMLEVTKTQMDEKVLVVKGKGAKGRVVPFGHRSLVALVKYLSNRNKLFGREGILFLTKQGKPLTLRMTNKTIERIGEKANIQNVRLSAHTFRHSFAKSWLMNGGDPFSLQRVLGHTTLDMVKNYVNMTYRDIQSQHSKFSPGDNLPF